MPKTPKGPKFELGVVRDITQGPEAQSRKRHNKAKPEGTGQHFDLPINLGKKQRPGEVYTAKTPQKDQDQLDRELIKASKADQERSNQPYEGKPRPGEVLEAREGPEKEKQDRQALEKFLRHARERFKLAEEAEAENRKDALDDLKFLTGEQWSSDIKAQRELDSRPCLTMNRLPQFIRQVTNEQRQQRPAIQINPVGDGADTDTADIYQGIIRHIEVNSDAEIAYDTAFEQMVGSGIGFWRIGSRYKNDKGTDQEIYIESIRNPFNVYSDPAAVKPDKSDARFKFVIEDMPIDEYKDQYGDTEAASLVDFTSVGDTASDWATRDTIRVAEYWYVEEIENVIAHMADGSVVPKDKIPEGQTAESERTVTKRTIKCAKINAIEIIKEWTWPGSYIPIVEVVGDDYEVDGKRKVSGMVRHAKDAQRMYNYWVTAATELIALAPKAPFIVAEGQIENHENEWKAANVRNLTVLQYKPTDVAGHPVPPPQRQQFEPPVQAINLMTRQADNDLKATTGIYDASLGEKGPDQSGRAILARQKQSDVATLNFSDNLARALRHTGRILIEAIPHFYDTPRVQRIIYPDQTQAHVGVYNSQNLPPEVDPRQLQQFQSIKRIYDIGVGEYDVTVSVGPSYQSKRQEAAASMLEFMKAYPQAAPLIGDLVAKNFDWHGSKEIAERLKKMLPPQLQDDQDDPEIALQRYKNQLQQAMTQHDLLVKALQHAENLLNTKQLELSSKERIAQIDSQTKVTVAEIGTKAQDARMRREFEFEEFKLMHGAAHDVGLEAMGHQNTLAQNQQQADLQPPPQDQSQAGAPTQ